MNPQPTKKESVQRILGTKLLLLLPAPIQPRPTLPRPWNLASSTCKVSWFSFLPFLFAGLRDLLLRLHLRLRLLLLLLLFRLDLISRPFLFLRPCPQPPEYFKVFLQFPSPSCHSGLVNKSQGLVPRDYLMLHLFSFGSC